MALFTEEGPSLYGKALKHNQRWATHQAPWTTHLTPAEGKRFRKWVRTQDVPFNPKAKRSDYDMRGYWKRTKGKSWNQGEHFPDKWKTPYDTSFSKESKYAKKGTPYEWHGEKLVNRNNGRVIYAPASTSSSSTKSERTSMKMKYGGPDNGRPMTGRRASLKKAKSVTMPGMEGRNYLSRLKSMPKGKKKGSYSPYS